MSKTELVKKMIEMTVRIDGKYFIPYKKAMDVLAEFEERPIIVRGDSK